MLVCTTMVMGLLPLSMHLCCEERCCETPVEQASCCALANHPKPALPDDGCCQDQSFFNLAPVFAPVKTCFEQHISAGIPLENCCYAEALVQVQHSNDFKKIQGKPPEPLRLHLRLGVLII